MNILTASAEHKSELKKLWQHCFHDDDQFVDFWFDTVFKPENTVIAIENDCILGALQIVFYDISINGNIVKSAYLCGVGVFEKYRRMKVGTMIMKYTQNILTDKGTSFVFLISEQDNFYKTLGYTPCVSKLSYEYMPVKPQNITYTVNNSPTASELKRIYSLYCKGLCAYIKRNESEFNYLTEHYALFSGGAVSFCINGTPSAYVIYDINDCIFQADEIAYANTEGLYAILDFIYRSGCKKAVVAASSSDDISQYINCISSFDSRTVWALSLTEKFSTKMLNNGYLSVL